jgi:hypothetical protein
MMQLFCLVVLYISPPFEICSYPYFVLYVYLVLIPKLFLSTILLYRFHPNLPSQRWVWSVFIRRPPMGMLKP